MRKSGLSGAFAFALILLCSAAHAQIVAFGASNISGWNVAARDAMPAQLQEMLRANGYSARVVNAGIYGNTTADMLGRLDADIPPGTRIVVLDTSGGIFNDLNKGISRQQSDADMAAIEAKLKARGITVLPVSAAQLPAQYHQADGVHLTPAGHRAIAAQLLPQVEQALGPPQATPAQAQAPAPSTELRDACAADARRLCADTLGDQTRRRECMHEHRDELSKDCVAAIVRSRQQ